MNYFKSEVMKTIETIVIILVAAIIIAGFVVSLIQTRRKRQGDSGSNEGEVDDKQGTEQ